MADADNSLQIAIQILTQQLGGEKAADVLKGIQEQAKLTGKEGVKAEEEVAEATKKTNHHHAEAKAILKGVGSQFPELAHAAHLALNPITLSVAAIVGSIAIWKHRTDELTKTLGGVELPNIGESDVQRIERIGAAMAKASAADAGQSAFAKLKSDLQGVISLIKDNEALFKAMGIDVSGQSLQAQAQATGAAAARLDADANAKIKAAGNPMSPEKEAAIGKLLKELAEAAEKVKEEHTARRDFIIDYKQSSGIERSLKAGKFLTRYGNDLSPDQAQANEQARIDEAQSIINRYGSFMSGAASRAGRRGLRDTGFAERDEAGSKDSEVVSLLRQDAANKARAALADSPFPEGAASPQQANAQIKYFQKQQEVMHAIAAATAASQAVLERVKNLERR